MPHLMFDDDLLMFGEATEAQIYNVTRSLELFCKLSSQEGSSEKTDIFSLTNKNVNLASQEHLVHLSGLGKCMILVNIWMCC